MTHTELPAIAPKPLVSAPTNHEIAGYMPGRLEFETEVENEAEDCVKDFEFGLVMDYGGREQPEGDLPALIPPTEGDLEREKEEAGGLRTAESAGSKGTGNGMNGQHGGSGMANTIGLSSAAEDDSNSVKDDDAQKWPPPVDPKSSVDFKLSLLSIYNEKVNKRLETKGVVFDRGLLEFKKV